MIDEVADPALAGYHPYPAEPTPTPAPTVNARTEAGWDDAGGLPGWG